MRAQTKRDVKRLRSEGREAKQRPARTWFRSAPRTDPIIQAQALEGDRASAALTALQDLYAAVDAPSRLSDYGFTPAAIGDAVERVVTVAPASNPVQVTRQGITSLLEHAPLGIPPILEPPHAPIQD